MILDSCSMRDIKRDFAAWFSIAPTYLLHPPYQGLSQFFLSFSLWIFFLEDTATKSTIPTLRPNIRNSSCLRHFQIGKWPLPITDWTFFLIRLILEKEKSNLLTLCISNNCKFLFCSWLRQHLSRDESPWPIYHKILFFAKRTNISILVLL